MNKTPGWNFGGFYYINFQTGIELYILNIHCWFKIFFRATDIYPHMYIIITNNTKIGWPSVFNAFQLYTIFVIPTFDWFANEEFVVPKTVVWHNKLFSWYFLIFFNLMSPRRTFLFIVKVTKLFIEKQQKHNHLFFTQIHCNYCLNC